MATQFFPGPPKVPLRTLISAIFRRQNRQSGAWRARDPIKLAAYFHRRSDLIYGGNAARGKQATGPPDMMSALEGEEGHGQADVVKEIA